MIINVGKYGLLWIKYMKENHYTRYRYHWIHNSLLQEAEKVNIEAYEMLDNIMDNYIKRHKPKNASSTMEMWRIREQAKMIAEEQVLNDIVYCVH